jgi:hypothetical protein
MQQQQVDKRSVPMHACMHERRDSRVVRGINRGAFTQKQPARVDHARRRGQ